MNYAIELEGVALRRGGRTLLAGIDWRVARGGCAALLGPNGAGKSTLLSILSGFTWPQEGRVRVLGETYGRVDLPRFRRRLGFVGSSRMPPFHDDMTALETVLAGMWGGVILPPREEPTEAQCRAALRELATAGLEGRAEEEMGKLSSGERMRVALARALAARPELLILDEPTNSLDMAARAAFAEALGRLRAERSGLTMLIVTHHVEDLPRGTDEALLLREGKIVAAGEPPKILTGELLSRTFGCEVEAGSEDGRYWTRVKSGRAWDL